MSLFALESPRVFSAANEVVFAWGNTHPDLNQVNFEFFNVANASWPGILSAQFSINNGSSWDTGTNYKYNGFSKWRNSTADPSHEPPVPNNWPQLKALLTSTQSNVTGDGTAVKVAFNTVEGDLFSDMNITSNQGVFTARQAGWHRFKGHIHLLSTGGFGRCETRLIASGGQAVRVGPDNNLGAVSFGESAHDFDGVIWLAAAETCYVELKVSGGAKTIDIYGDPLFTWCYVELLGSQQYGLTPHPSAVNDFIAKVVPDTGDNPAYGTDGTFILKTAGTINSQPTNASFYSKMQRTDGGGDIIDSTISGRYFGAPGSLVNGVKFLMTGANPAPTISGMIKAYGIS